MYIHRKKNVGIGPFPNPGQNLGPVGNDQGPFGRGDCEECERAGPLSEGEPRLGSHYVW